MHLGPLTEIPAERAGRPRWSVVLRAVREARGVTLEGWAARIGVSRATVQRWERGARAPDPAAEAAILAYCHDTGLFRSYDRGPLAGVSLTMELLRDLLAEARWRVSGVPDTATPAPPAADAEQSGSLSPRPPRMPGLSLPAPMTSFVGREQELAALRRSLGGARLLTLTGVGGGGKTRLALQLADELLWAYPHGVCFVELASLADPALAPETVGAALGLHTSGERPMAEVLQEQLAPRHLLLLLDNCEHLLAACANLVETLLRACPHLTVLATSREALGILGEMVWPVQPLSPADATRLFLDRARSYRPDMELSEAKEAVIEQICARLDGLPLAIELAAVRVRALSVGQIAERLNDRFQLLTGGCRTALPRHQTLRAALGWSHDLLTAPEQALLRRLAVFAGGFTLEAAELVCSAGEQERADVAPASLPAEDVLDTLSSLVDKSLVIAHHRDGAVRYRLLETVRQYAGEQLEAAGEATATRVRHRDWCFLLAEQAEAALHSASEGVRFAQLEEEHDNLRATLSWLLALHGDQATAALRLAGFLVRFWEVHGHMSEGRQWLTQALAAGAGAPTDLRARALERVWWLAYMQGDYASARAHTEECLALYRELGDARGIARAHSQLAGLALRCAGQDEARTLMERSLALNVEVRDTWGMAAAQCGLGILALREGDYPVAQSRLTAGLALHRKLGNKEGIANALMYLATAAGEQGDADQQADLLADALRLFRDLGNKGGVALVLGDLGIHAWLQGEQERARLLLDESLALHRERAERRGISRVLANLGLLALHQRDHARAAALCRQGLALSRELGDQWAIGQYVPVLAAVEFGQGRLPRAARLLGAAAALRERLGIPLPRAVRSTHDGTLAAIQAALDGAAFASAWAAGQALSPDDAIAEALAEPR